MRRRARRFAGRHRHLPSHQRCRSDSAFADHCLRRPGPGRAHRCAGCRRRPRPQLPAAGGRAPRQVAGSAAGAARHRSARGQLASDLRPRQCGRGEGRVHRGSHRARRRAGGRSRPAGEPRRGDRRGAETGWGPSRHRQDRNPQRDHQQGRPVDAERADRDEQASADQHHEKLDGTGYPDGIRGSAFPVPAQILQLADIYDAITTDRPYHRARTRASAVEFLHGEASKGWRDHELVKLIGVAAENLNLGRTRDEDIPAPPAPIGQRRTE
ncbi:MAG: hypothetical protein E6J88_10525 [Deltaproteobacteria bacterium]|nr:MAG: hypothetical protein E6J88_10525 [Deltaproteobacteria bacterium]